MVFGVFQDLFYKEAMASMSVHKAINLMDTTYYVEVRRQEDAEIQKKDKSRRCV